MPTALFTVLASAFHSLGPQGPAHLTAEPGPQQGC